MVKSSFHNNHKKIVAFSHATIFLRRIRIFGQFPLFLSNDSAIFVANYPTIMQRKIYVGFSLYLYIINVKIKKKILDDRKRG